RGKGSLPGMRDVNTANRHDPRGPVWLFRQRSRRRAFGSARRVLQSRPDFAARPSPVRMLTTQRPRRPSRLRRAIYQLRTEGSGSRAREAWTIGIGLFIGCSPLIGFHLGIALLVGWLLSLNRVKLYLAANLVNPVILPGIFFAEVQTGHWLRRGHAYPITLETFHKLKLWHFGLDLLLRSLVVGAALWESWAAC